MKGEIKAIESGIQRAPEGKFSKAPWPNMQLNDCIAFDTIGRARQAVKRANERWAPKQFEADYDTEGTPRAWRVA